jgi:outer membrane protein assembly factor BamB
MWRFAAATVLLALLAACDKEKDVEPPAELVDFNETLTVQRVWSASLGGGDEVMRGGLAPAAEGERVFVAGRGGDVLALQGASGKTLWRARTKAELTGGPGAGQGLVVVGTADGGVIALDAVTGTLRWTAKLGG